MTMKRLKDVKPGIVPEYNRRHTTATAGPWYVVAGVLKKTRDEYEETEERMNLAGITSSVALTNDAILKIAGA